MRLGPSTVNSWEVKADFVDLVRPALPPRRCAISAQSQNIIVDLNRTAVIIVDMQNDFCTAGGWFDAKGADIEPMRRPVPVLNALLPNLRDAGATILWVNWGNRADLANLPPSVFHAGNPAGDGFGYGDTTPEGRAPILERDSWGAAVIDDLSVDPGDILVLKSRFSGFADNELDSVLRNRAISTLLFMGINTDRCVLATLMDASFLGYDCVLVEDACATSSPTFCTDAVLYLMKQLYGFTTTSADILEALRAQSADTKNLRAASAGQ